jgi:DNA topoisomerase IA
MASTDSSGAHEAIRPADPQQFPEHQAGLLPDAAALYQLVWDRFLASEMKAARYQIIDVELENV